jgi:hypothetical protein
MAWMLFLRGLRRALERDVAVEWRQDLLVSLVLGRAQRLACSESQPETADSLT